LLYLYIEFIDILANISLVNYLLNFDNERLCKI
jgi:hypothetical protein